ncbi:hypothetical protein BDA96_01G542300 [Sorghum bicolor]|uniref:Embryo surrounding factor 1 brassicaceae domain-containing protein n=2 Tax=Sorghum bicolor TaxID=4558 RepID=A0A921S7I2_SORBI|nr:hypothetical protein BDA96_01G542300 [Sorghum bicolor]OQU93253.1 hypothetical protein SORBI_3001G507933 [Sorghum bicolor]
MNDRCGGLGFMVIILFLAASSTTVLSGRSHLLEVRNARTGSNNTTTTLGDESKLTLIFCEEKSCGDYGDFDCYCCLPMDTCYSTQAECREVCPRCDPQCSPP